MASPSYSSTGHSHFSSPNLIFLLYFSLIFSYLLNIFPWIVCHHVRLSIHKFISLSLKDGLLFWPLCYIILLVFQTRNLKTIFDSLLVRPPPATTSYLYCTNPSFPGHNTHSCQINSIKYILFMTLMIIFEGWYLITCGINFSLLSLSIQGSPWVGLTLCILPTSLHTLCSHHGFSNFNVSQNHLGELVKIQIHGSHHPGFCFSRSGNYNQGAHILSSSLMYLVYLRNSPTWTLYTSQISFLRVS